MPWLIAETLLVFVVLTLVLLQRVEPILALRVDPALRQRQASSLHAIDEAKFRDDSWLPAQPPELLFNASPGLQRLGSSIVGQP